MYRPRTTRFGSSLNLARVHWVRPKLVIAVACVARTHEGPLRQVTYQGIREDKPASGVRITPYPGAQSCTDAAQANPLGKIRPGDCAKCALRHRRPKIRGAIEDCAPPSFRRKNRLRSSARNTIDGRKTFEPLTYGEYDHNMPQTIRVTDSEERSRVYVPITVDSRFVDSKGFNARKTAAAEQAEAARPKITAARTTSGSICQRGDVRASQAQPLGDPLHREPSGGTELDSKIAFFPPRVRAPP
jgi:hypothetical protein